jgi:hypothetical protein
MTDLESAAADLKAARQETYLALTLCAGYIDALALAGDPTAAHLAGKVAAAHDRLTATNIAAHTAKELHR